MSTTQKITGAVVEFISGAVTSPHDSMSVEVETPRIYVPAANIAGIRCDLYAPRPVVGSVPVRVVITLRDRTTQVASVAAKVRLFDTAVVAARKLNRLESLSSSDLRLDRREVTGLSDAYFTSVEDLAGKRTTRIIVAGTVLENMDVETIPLIKRGSGVVVVVVVGGVTVTSKAKALEDGYLGDIIRVQDLITGKRLAATVRGETLVFHNASSL
jgi:flagella basal body P-ring formation protein FlgA